MCIYIRYLIFHQKYKTQIISEIWFVAGTYSFIENIKPNIYWQPVSVFLLKIQYPEKIQ